jgi:hypothetical protein
VPTIAALIVSLPERAHLLTECLASVHAQTRQPDDIVIGIDPRRLGECRNMERLQRSTDCEWYSFLHDDDLMHPEHLALAEKFMDDHDVIVARFTLEGRPRESMEPFHSDFEDLRRTNWISSPSCVIARSSVCDRWVGPQNGRHWNDWAQWNYLLDKGARFVDTGTISVTCRFGSWGNGSWHA